MLRRREGTCSSSRSDDEVGGYKGAIRACDVRAADLQEEPTKRVEKRAGPSDTIVSLDPTKTAARGEHRSERSEPIRQRAPVEQSSTPDRGDEARPAGQIGMIAYADEATVPDEDLWSGLPLQISVLNAEQAGRS